MYFKELPIEERSREQHNNYNGMSIHRRLRSVYTSMQSDQSLCWILNAMNPKLFLTYSEDAYQTVCLISDCAAESSLCARQFVGFDMPKSNLTLQLLPFAFSKPDSAPLSLTLSFTVSGMYVGNFLSLKGTCRSSDSSSLESRTSGAFSPPTAGVILVQDLRRFEAAVVVVSQTLLWLVEGAELLSQALEIRGFICLL